VDEKVLIEKYVNNRKTEKLEISVDTISRLVELSMG
jgi:hypothetical protein